jgi:arylsulfatase A-like enzyme
LAWKTSARKTTEAVISLADIPKTVWAAAGVVASKGAAKDSVNQLPVLLNPAADPVRPKMLDLGTLGLAIRSGDWVYIRAQGSQGITTDLTNTWAWRLNDLGEENADYDAHGHLMRDASKKQLYNLRTDPCQKHNVRREYPQKADELAKRYAELVKSLR